MADRSITTGGKERVGAASKLFTKVFETDPVITYLLCSMSPEERLTYLPKYFDALLMASALNKGTIDEIGDWKCCSILMPPRCRVDNLWTLLPAGFLSVLWTAGIGSCVRMLNEFQRYSDMAKRKGLGKQKDYYYLFFTGTREDCRGQGLCSEILKSYQEIASRKGLPIWLESTTENSMRLYKKLGWETVTEIVLGKGRAGADGLKSKGGQGVKIWAMIWRPKVAQAN